MLVERWQSKARSEIFTPRAEFMNLCNLTSIWKVKEEVCHMQQDMILDYEKQWKNYNLVLCLQTWALSAHKNVEVWPKHWPSVSCCQAKVGADESN